MKLMSRLAVLAIFVSMVGAVSIASAQDHPVLLDGLWVGGDAFTMGTTGKVSGSTTIVAQAKGRSVSSHTLGGYLDMIGSSAHASHGLWFQIYEPDLVKRSGTKNTVKQKTHLGYAFDFHTDGYRLGGSSNTSFSGIAPSCGGQFQGKEPGAVPDEAPIAFKVKCKDLIFDLGLSPDHAAALADYYAGIASNRIGWPKKFKAADPVSSFSP